MLEALQNSFSILQEVFAKAATQHPFSLVIGALMFALFSNLYSLHKTILIHRDNKKNGYPVHDNLCELQLHILYSCVLAFVLLLLSLGFIIRNLYKV
jgi:hypothetical protein